MGLPRPDHHGIQRAVILTDMTGLSPDVYCGDTNWTRQWAPKFRGGLLQGMWQIDPAGQSIGRSAQ